MDNWEIPRGRHHETDSMEGLQESDAKEAAVSHEAQARILRTPGGQFLFKLSEAQRFDSLAQGRRQSWPRSTSSNSCLAVVPHEGEMNFVFGI